MIIIELLMESWIKKYTISYKGRPLLRVVISGEIWRAYHWRILCKRIWRPGKPWRGRWLVRDCLNYAPIYGCRSPFYDDSPADGEGGPVIYSVRLKVNDKYHGEIIPMSYAMMLPGSYYCSYKNNDFRIFIRNRRLRWADRNMIILGSKNDSQICWFFLFKGLYSGAKPTTVKESYNINLGNKYYTLIDPGSVPVAVNGTEAAVYFLWSYQHQGTCKPCWSRNHGCQRLQNSTAYIYTSEAKDGHDTVGNTWTIIRLLTGQPWHKPTEM